MHWCNSIKKRSTGNWRLVGSYLTSITWGQGDPTLGPPTIIPWLLSRNSKPSVHIRPHAHLIFMSSFFPNSVSAPESFIERNLPAPMSSRLDFCNSLYLEIPAGRGTTSWKLETRPYEPQSLYVFSLVLRSLQDKLQYLPMASSPSHISVLIPYSTIRPLRSSHHGMCLLHKPGIFSFHNIVYSAWLFQHILYVSPSVALWLRTSFAFKVAIYSTLELDSTVLVMQTSCGTYFVITYPFRKVITDHDRRLLTLRCSVLNACV